MTNEDTREILPVFGDPDPVADIKFLFSIVPAPAPVPAAPPEGDGL